MNISAVSEFISQLPSWTVYISIVISCLSCFFGYKFLKTWTALIGFVMGMFIGYYATARFVDNLGVAILAGFLVGLLFGFLGYRIYLLGVFVVAFFVTMSLCTKIPIKEEWAGIGLLIATVVVAVVVGVIALKFVRPVIIIATALNGAFSAVPDILHLLGENSNTVIWTASAIVFVLGVVVQFATTKGKKRIFTKRT